MPQPYKLVPTPQVEPYRYGLFSQALNGDDQGDPHTYLGVEYEALAAYAADVRPGSCYQTPGADFVSDARIGTIHGLPFSIFAGLDGTAVGHSEAELIQRGRAVLDLGAQFAAERALWTGAGGTIGLNAATTTVAATGLSITAGFAAAEDYLAQHYGGKGLIHAPRLLATFAARQQLLRDAGTPRGETGTKKLETVLGTGLVFGGGYNNTGPNAVAPAANHAWIYVTGVVEAFRAAPFISGGLAQALNRSTNRAVLWVEQPTVLTYDSLAPKPQTGGVDGAPVAAIDIDLTL